MKDKTTLEYERRIEANAKKSQKLAEDAKALYLKLVEVDKRYQTLRILLEGKRREYAFAESYKDKEVIRAEVLQIESEVRRYAALVDEYILQVRRAEINTIINK